MYSWMGLCLIVCVNVGLCVYVFVCVWSLFMCCRVCVFGHVFVYVLNVCVHMSVRVCEGVCVVCVLV